MSGGGGWRGIRKHVEGSRDVDIVSEGSHTLIPSLTGNWPLREGANGGGWLDTWRHTRTSLSVNWGKAYFRRTDHSARLARTLGIG